MDKQISEKLEIFNLINTEFKETTGKFTNQELC